MKIVEPTFKKKLNPLKYIDMKTRRNIQIAITVVALFVAVKLADNMSATTNELIGSIMLVLSSGVSLLTLLHGNERSEAK